MEGITSIENLKCDYLTNPIGIDDMKPVLSWSMKSDLRNKAQTSYRIIVSSEENLINENIGDMWDTGYINSENSINIIYDGKLLESYKRYYWKVFVYDESNNLLISKIAFWEMGLLNKRDCKAKWICKEITGANDVPTPAPYFRKLVGISKSLKNARLYICGLGYYELSVNGELIGDDVLKPAFTRYDKTVLYNTYDITDILHEGQNVIGVILGNGWYNCFTKEVWNFHEAPWRDNPKLIAQLHLYYEDGSFECIVSDETWKTSYGPIRFDGLRNGEIYDARYELVGWDKSDFDDSKWTSAVITRSPGGVLKSRQMTPIKVTDIIKPVDLKEVKPGVWVYDMGQNFAGWVRIKVKGVKGTEVKLKYAEKLKEDGDIDTSNIDVFIKSGECQTDTYILKGEGLEIWSPRFTYHGFRYVRVTGFPGIPTLDNLEGCFVHTAFDSRGFFECSNDLLNKIQKCSWWSTLSNYYGIPTDCPHREKNGWTGDAQLSAEQVLLNFDPMSAYTKWMHDFRDVQRPSGQLPGIVPTGGWGYNWGSGPAWDSAVVLIPWYMYLYNGDTKILSDMYETMKNYVDFVSSMSTDYIVDFGLGDWCPPVGGAGDHKCPTKVTDTAYYYVDSLILYKIALLLGKKDDVKTYGELSKKIKEAFLSKFVKKDGYVEGDTETSMACALYQGLVNDDLKENVLNALISEVNKQNNHIDCGILGAKYIMHALTENGKADLAYEIATQRTFPGWGWWIEQGATTLWETWDGTSSRNHHMFSDISAWFYKGLAGINADEAKPGFKHIIISPNIVDDLTWVKAWHESMYGKIEVYWEIKNDIVELTVNIPANTTATVYLPCDCIDKVKLDGKNIKDDYNIKILKTEGKRLPILIGSGKYEFSFEVR